MKERFFSKQLLLWHQNENDRKVPWRGEKDPYKIWLSEIILQQTRLEQGLPYYLNFIKEYPSIQDLALAPEQEVFKLWQGLGYYSRCRNLITTATYINEKLNGKFPDNYKELIQLKGVGPYTAAAIASFAFGEAVAVIDGNVYRVLSRYFTEETPIDTRDGKKRFQELIHHVFDPEFPADFNQAIMDLGATVCTPKKPNCSECPLKSKCKAFNLNLTESFPIKSKKLIIKIRHFDYWVFIHQQHIFIRQRTEKDIWQNLYEFYLEDFDTLKEKLENENNMVEIKAKVFETKQKLTHQLIYSSFSIVHLKEIPSFLKAEGLWKPIEELRKFAFPKTILSFLKEIHYFYYLN
ncbi:MAG TPA: A/G-specific adenine glycosylase [Edaphocola sp.]|nr:A/G-specific adenine glycosylase [Edaphocola sp.]